MKENLIFEEESVSDGLETPTEECVLSCHGLDSTFNIDKADFDKPITTDIRSGTTPDNFTDLKVTPIETTDFNDVCDLKWIDLQKQDKSGTMILLNNPSNPLQPENGHYKENVSYEKMHFLAEGAFAKVLLAKDKKSKKSFVVKEYKLLTESFLNMIKTEMRILSILSHYDNFLSFYACCYFSKTVSVFMEQFEGQSFCVDLRTYVNNHDVPTYDLQSIFKDVTTSLKIMHENGIRHEDIKLENILVANVEGKIKAKLIDFNCSKFQEDTCDPKRGNPLSWSPEKITCRSYDFKNDIWSLGIAYLTAKTKSLFIFKHVTECTEPFQFLYQLGSLSKSVTNDAIYEDVIKMRKDPQATLQLLRYSSRLANMTNFELDFIHSALSINPQQRLDATQLLSMDIFTNRKIY